MPAKKKKVIEYIPS